MEDLTDENIVLKKKNTELKQQLRRYRKSLRSTLNILDPDQRDIIKHDLIHTENLEVEEYAQPEF